METPEQIEKALREKLIPRGFSERGLSALNATIDELEGESDTVVHPRRPWWLFTAAAIFMALGLSFMVDFSSPSQAVAKHVASNAGVELISESEGIVAMEPEDELVSDEYGRLMKAYRVRVVSEELYEDGQTGHQVRVLRPRSERVLMPVSTF